MKVAADQHVYGFHKAAKASASSMGERLIRCTFSTVARRSLSCLESFVLDVVATTTQAWIKEQLQESRG